MARPMPSPSASLLRAFRILTLNTSNSSTICSRCTPHAIRTFATTSPSQNWLQPKSPPNKKYPKGRPHVQTGGSTRGTTLVWGTYGLRLLDHHRRISATQLRIGEAAIRGRLRGERYRLYTRVAANIGVYTKGNESRMGKGKGSFDHWATRVSVSKVLFELSGNVHEKVVRDAFRLAGNKLPGNYEFVKKGDPPVMGIAKVVTPRGEAGLRSPRKEEVVGTPSLADTAGRLGHGLQMVEPVVAEVERAPSVEGAA